MAIPNDTFFVDQNRRWPCPDPVTLPNVKAIVLDDRIADPQLLCRRYDSVQRLLPEKLRGVHPDNCKTMLFVFGVPGPQLRDNVLTVDSAVGPKFNQYDPALQVSDCKRFAIEPRPTRNVRSRFAGGKRLAMGGPKTPRRQRDCEKNPRDKAMARSSSKFASQLIHISWGSLPTLR